MTEIKSTDDTRFQQTLYKVHSTGKVGTWEVLVILHEDLTATTLVRTAKTVGGKVTETPTHYTKGKNLGRSNETTPLMQATFEAQAKVKKKLDSGYVEEEPKPGDTATNAAGRTMPMLAKVFESVKSIKFPVYVQVKLDGNRMMAVVEDGRVVLYSRKGNEITSCPHVAEALKDAFDSGRWDGRTLDGEIYLHGLPLQKINSLVKKQQPESAGLIYHVYDVVMPGDFADRLEYLHSMFDGITAGPVQHLKTTLCHNMQELEVAHETAVAEAFEGTIVRQTGVEYSEGGKRCSQLLKKKDYQDAEFEVIGLSEGKPTRNGNKVGIFHCKTTDGKVFTVTAPGDEKQRHEHALYGEKRLGEKLTVKFFCYTLAGVPSQPTAVAFRDEI